MVRDTDGSAFITKAEFDSLKNNFQAQIDNYNTSIDSKIDGAIAAYLAGVKLLTRQTVQCLGYTPDGVLSVLPYENIDWKEGDISFDITIITYGGNDAAHGSGGPHTYRPGFMTWKLPARGVRSGHLGPSECLVTVFNRDSSSTAAGLWRGLFEDNRINITGFAANEKDPGLYNPVSTGAIYIRNSVSMTGLTQLGNGWWRVLSNKKIENIAGTTNIIWQTTWGSSPSSNSSTIQLCAQQCSASRVYGTSKYKNIISASKNNEFGRFTDYDGFWDFMNDGRFDGHTIVKSESDYFNDPQYDSKYYDVLDGSNHNGPFSPSWGNYMIDVTENETIKTWIKNNMSNNAAQSVLYPYVGFVRNLNNFNKIYTDSYTSAMPAIEAKHPSVKLYNDETSGMKYLNVGSGFVFGEVKANSTLEIPLRFQDEAKSYDIWFKIGPFDPSSNAWSSTDYLRVYTNETCTVELPAGAHANSTKVSGTSNKIYMKPNSDGFLFMMWTYNDSTKTGGGVFMPEQNFISIVE